MRTAKVPLMNKNCFWRGWPTKAIVEMHPTIADPQDPECAPKEFPGYAGYFCRSVWRYAMDLFLGVPALVVIVAVYVYYTSKLEVLCGSLYRELNGIMSYFCPFSAVAQEIKCKNFPGCSTT